MWLPERRRGIHSGFRWRNLRERGYLEDLGVDGNTWILGKEDVWAWNICIRVESGRSGRLFGILKWSYGCNKLREISWLFQENFTSQKFPTLWCKVMNITAAYIIMWKSGTSTFNKRNLFILRRYETKKTECVLQKSI